MKRIELIRFFVISCFLLVGSMVYGQATNALCSNPTPFCTANVVNYPAATNAPAAGPGPNYGCLGSQPNPAWFFFQMQTGGPVTITMGSNNDIDFILWGPFTCLAGACNSLTANNTIDCSYSPSPTETCTIPAAVQGAYYILLITNFSNQMQNITFNQTNGNAPGAGVTNCNVVCSVTATNSGLICPGGTATVGATTGSAVTSYTWVGPNGYSSTNLSNVISNIQSNSSYTIIANAAASTSSCGSAGGSTCQAVTNISVVPLPVYAVVPPTSTVCQNGSFIVSVAIPNAQAYNYQWSGPPGLTFTSPNGSGSFVGTAPISTQTALLVYTVVVTPTVLNCPQPTTLSVLINNPPTPTLTMPQPMCSTLAVAAITVNPPGGTFFGSPLVNNLGIITPNTATSFGTFSVGYTYTLGNCTTSTTANFSVARYNTAALTGTIGNRCVKDPAFNLLSIVSNTQGVWSGIGIPSGSNSFDASGPAPLPPLITGSYVLTYNNPSTPVPFNSVCMATSTIMVNVFNPPTPTIVPIVPKCTNAPTVALGASPGGGVWSGNPGVSPGGIQSPGLSSNLLGTNSVTYTAGQGTCVASASATYHVSRYNTAALNTSALNICVTTNTIDLMSLVSSTVNGSWLQAPGQPPGLIIGTYSFNPAGLATGSYVLTYSTFSNPNPNLCPETSSLTIGLLNPAKPVISAVSPKCSADAPFQLMVSPATGSFVPSLYVTASGIFTPSLSAIGQNPVQYIIGTSTCNATDTRLVSVEAFVPSTIITPVPDQCNTSPMVNLQPITANNQGSWSGPGVIGTNFNPAVSGVGDIVLSYNTTSSPNGLCPSQSTLAVKVYSLANPSIDQQGPFCNSGAPIKLTVSPLGGVFGGNNNASAVDPNGWFNPAYAAIGKNIVNYSVAAGPCMAYAQQTIVIEQFVSADFAKYAGPFCKNDPAVDLNTLAQYPGGAWTGPGVAANSFNPADANIGNTNLIIYRTHSITDDLCPDTSAMRIMVNDVPKVSIVRDIKQGCNPVEVTFNTPNTNTGKGEWTLGDGSDPEKGLTVSHTYTAPGTYSVVFNYWDDIGCSTQTVMANAVTVFEVPQPDFSYSPYQEVTIAEPLVQFVNQTPNLGSNTYEWKIAESFSTTEVNPKANFTKAGDYRITLTAITLDGCKAELTRILVVKPDFNVFIPNTFTPNEDGLNDTFIPVFSNYGLDTKTFEMEIFDRWGASLYHTRDITQGWKGTLNNKGDEPLKQEVYVYRIKYKDLQGKIYTKLGSVTLLR